MNLTESGPISKPRSVVWRNYMPGYYPTGWSEVDPRTVSISGARTSARGCESAMFTRDWFFDELAHAGREHLDPDYVAAYDRKARSDAVAAEEVRVLRNFGLNGRSTLVDLGAGTG